MATLKASAITYKTDQVTTTDGNEMNKDLQHTPLFRAPTIKINGEDLEHYHSGEEEVRGNHHLNMEGKNH